MRIKWFPLSYPLRKTIKPTIISVDLHDLMPLPVLCGFAPSSHEASAAMNIKLNDRSDRFLLLVLFLLPLSLVTAF